MPIPFIKVLSNFNLKQLKLAFKTTKNKFKKIYIPQTLLNEQPTKRTQTNKNIQTKNQLKDRQQRKPPKGTTYKDRQIQDSAETA